MELCLNTIFFDLPKRLSASYGAFLGKILFYVFGNGFKFVNVVFGA
jgi:hypothetical protein